MFVCACIVCRLIRENRLKRCWVYVKHFYWDVANRQYVSGKSAIISKAGKVGIKFIHVMVCMIINLLFLTKAIKKHKKKRSIFPF